MSLWRQLTRGLRVLGNRTAADREIDDEVSQYLEEATAALIAKGHSPEEARRSARLELGGATAVRDQVCGYGWENAVETVSADLRYAVRRLWQNPGFAAVSILTLGLGIGASTAIFSVVEAVLLRPLPYAHPEQLVRIWEQAQNGHRMNIADLNFEDFRTQNTTFARMADYQYRRASVSGGSEPARVDIAEVNVGFFEVLGVAPLRGRGFSPGEQRLHGARAAMVSYSYWQRYLGGVADLSQFHLAMLGAVYPVVGVMPGDFAFPPEADIWIPRELDREHERDGHNWRGLGRVRDGVTLAQARANLSAIAHRIKAEYGKGADLTGAAVAPLSEALVGNVRTALMTLIGAVGLLLLVACANVAGLLLARTAARRKELAVRAALGAGRGRLIQQFLAECFALASAGGALGILIAAGAARVLPAILPANLPRQAGIAINAPVLLFGLGAVAVVTVSLGLFAAWRAGRGDLQETLASGSRNSTGTVASQRLRSYLVIGEIATTLVILTGAGLLGRSFLRLVSTSPGFNQQNLITMEFLPPIPQATLSIDQAEIVRQEHLLGELLSRLRRISGVESIGLTDALPVAAGDNLADGGFVVIDGHRPPANFAEFGRMLQNPAQSGHASYCVASEGYFRTLGIPLMRGRLFGEQDDSNSPHVAVISETLARQRWPNQDPVGQSIGFGNMDGNMKPIAIVGVVGDVRARGLDLAPSPIIYVDYRQRGMNANSVPIVLARSAAPLARIVPAARAVFHDLVPDVPVKFARFEDEMGGWLADRRFLLLLVGLFAGAALALAAVGIYGVVAFSVTRRTQEIGVRMAIGAQRGDVLRLVVGEGARLAILGVAIGLAASFFVARLMSSLLFGVTATDPVTFASVAVLLAVVALAASYLPARRAVRLDPSIALRNE